MPICCRVAGGLPLRGAWHAVGAWQELFDPSTDRVFFYNKVTGVSQWERPPSMMAAVALRASAASLTPVISPINGKVGPCTSIVQVDVRR